MRHGQQKTEHRGQTGARSKGAFCIAAFVCCLSSVLWAPPSYSSSWDPADVLKSYIMEHYPWSRVEISDVRLNHEAPPDSPVGITIDKNPPGKTTFSLAFQKSGSVSGSATVKAYDRVVMSRGPFNKGYTLKQDDVYTTQMETGRIPKGAIRDEDLLINRQLARSLVPNMPITDAMVSLAPVVKRGRKIMLLAGADGFAIKTIGELKHDATIGDYVKAINLASKKVVSGVLVDENTVRVEF